MFSFFVPISKVQKDRRIIRETDMRMAKYSRRGLIVNFIAFLVCLYGGNFLTENRELTIVLTIGLLLITFLRGIFLFRFDQLYPRAPNKWRNQYFVATLLGAIWWSVIMCSITIVLHMRHEAPLFWLYTVVFFSTTAHAFAPYQKFLSVYQFMGLIPGALVALFLGTTQGYLYGGLLIVFYVVLNHQCRLMSENYWERLEASFALGRKAISLEEEKKDTRASARLNLEFLEYFERDFEKLLQKEGGNDLEEHKALYGYVRRFKRILSKDLNLKSFVFNVRHELQSIVADYIDVAEEKGIKLETSLSPTLPMRLVGDPKRLGGVIQNLIEINLQGMDSGLLLVEAEFIREYEQAGELYVNVSMHCEAQKGLFFREKEIVMHAEENLSYVVSQGVAELMEGGIERNEVPRQGITYRFNAKLEIADTAGQLDFHRNSFSGHTVLLINSNANVVDIKRQALEALGVTVVTETQYDRALEVLHNNSRLERPIEAVVYYIDGDGEDALSFHHALNDNKDLSFIRQILAVTNQQRSKLPKHMAASETLFLVNKPVGLFELESTFHKVYSDLSEGKLAKHTAAYKALSKVFIVSENKEHAAALLELLTHETIDVSVLSGKKAVLDGVKSQPDLILVDVSERKDARALIKEMRDLERAASFESLIPILGFANEETETSTVYEIGIDDKIEISDAKEDVVNIVRYWATLH